MTSTPKKLALLHTSPVAVTVVHGALREVDATDSPLSYGGREPDQEHHRGGHLQKVTIRRLISLIASGFDAGADAVLVTCSSIGPGVEIAQSLFDRPVIRVDEAMAKSAVERGRVWASWRR